MSIAGEVAIHLPYLRRYARALTGSQLAGDAYVRATLEAALADRALAESLRGGRVPLYRAFNRLWDSAHVAVEAELAASGHDDAAGAAGQLRRVTPANRQALLLTTVEDFTAADAAAIMGRDPAEVERLVAEAMAEIDRETATSVLIIEDEPLIAMQLAELVSELGHQVCGTAATRTQAAAATAAQRPGLVLADIQLADGSSGLDAVQDIFADGQLPVIFITAFPERLLTGERPEPTWLITKPFEETTVKAAISQALFFGASQPA